MLYNIGNFWLH